MLTVTEGAIYLWSGIRSIDGWLTLVLVFPPRRAVAGCAGGRGHLLRRSPRNLRLQLQSFATATADWVCPLVVMVPDASLTASMSSVPTASVQVAISQVQVMSVAASQLKTSGPLVSQATLSASSVPAVSLRTPTPGFDGAAWMLLFPSLQITVLVPPSDPPPRSTVATLVPSVDCSTPL